MAEMNEEQIQHIIQTWAREYTAIGNLDYISYVQIFENKGPLMGASSPHPHGQIWANEHIPTNIAKELASQQTYFTKHSSPLLLDYLKLEQKDGKRVIYENDAFMVVVPFWATWPYETMIIPKTHKASLVELTEDEQKLLANALKHITHKYDLLFKTPFPYSMGIHQAPTDKKAHDEWQMHIHFYPPLLRSATVKKYFVGYEMFAESQRDINPEDAAQTLRDLNG
jgi:UDPglucose--hexose-1-phosphate uridylyltransferase